MLAMNFNPFPVLETKRLILRRLKLSDAESIFAHRSNERVNLYLDNFRHASIEVTRAFIEKVNSDIANNAAIFWVLTEKGKDEFIGAVCLWNIDKQKEKSEVGYTMEPEFYGKGYMNEALEAALGFGLNTIGLKEIEAYTHEKNQPSINLLKRNHFKQTSVLKEDAGINRLVFTLTTKR